MEDLLSLRQRALAHMRTTLALLDETGEADAACHLQMAHDIVARISPTESRDELSNDFAALPDLTSDPVLMCAIGGALAVFSTLMVRDDVPTINEVAAALGICVVASSQIYTKEGLISWCAISSIISRFYRNDLPPCPG